MDLQCNMRIYLWKPDESDLKKDATYCKYCKKCRDNANEYFEKLKKISILNFFMVVVLLITSDIVKDTFQGNHLGYG